MRKVLALAAVALAGASAGALAARSIGAPPAAGNAPVSLCVGGEGPVTGKLDLDTSVADVGIDVDSTQNLGAEASVAYTVEVVDQAGAVVAKHDGAPARVASAAARKDKARIGRLPDGYYSVRLNVAAATSGEDTAGAGDVKYLRVQGGRASKISSSEFYASSTANLGRKVN